MLIIRIDSFILWYKLVIYLRVGRRFLLKKDLVLKEEGCFIIIF